MALDSIAELTALRVDRLHGRRRHPSSSGVVAAAVAGALSVAVVASAAAQPSIRVGASVSQTGVFALLGQNQLRGYQLCVNHTNQKAGVLGRRLELVAEDDGSQPATAARIYERLITQAKVEAVIGPYSSLITDVVADVMEKHRMPLVAPSAATSSIFRKGRKFIFMLPSRAEVYFEGLIDMAARRGLKTLAVVHEDTLFPRASAQGAVELAKKRGLSVVLVEAYPKGAIDFSAILAKVGTANPDVLAAATYFEDAVAITGQLKASNVSPRMFAVTVGGDLPKFYEVLGPSAEFVYGVAAWELQLMALLRGGELVPLARRYPGAREFVESHRQEFPGADLSYHSAAGYGGCQVLVEAIRRAGSLDGAKVRAAILGMSLNTVYGGFKVDRDGIQTAHTMLTFQWQDGKKVIVWPDELAPGKPRFPTPPWRQR
jgi:branched-chain amino acid transport system substrate-binding protein